MNYATAEDTVKLAEQWLTDIKVLGLTPGEYYNKDYQNLFEIYFRIMPIEVGELKERIAGLPFLLMVIVYAIKGQQGRWRD